MISYIFNIIQLNACIYLTNIYAINLTDLFTVEPTKTQLDTWYDYYAANKDIGNTYAKNELEAMFYKPDEWKAINRAMAAKKANEEHIFEVFFQRAFELGSVSKQDYRNYKLEKLGI